MDALPPPLIEAITVHIGHRATAAARTKQRIGRRVFMVEANPTDDRTGGLRHEHVRGTYELVRRNLAFSRTSDESKRDNTERPRSLKLQWYPDSSQRHDTVIPIFGS